MNRQIALLREIRVVLNATRKAGSEPTVIYLSPEDRAMGDRLYDLPVEYDPIVRPHGCAIGAIATHKEKA